MNKFNGNGYFKFALAVAMSCLDDLGYSREHDAASFIQKALCMALENTGLKASVVPLSYHKCSKVPMRILINGKETGLLWYYPHMGDNQLIADLNDLMTNVAMADTRASA